MLHYLSVHTIPRRANLRPPFSEECASVPETRSDHMFLPDLAELMVELPCVLFRRQMSADGEIRYPYLSPNIAMVLGLSPEEVTVTGKGALNACHWADRDLHVAAIKHSAVSMARCRETFRAITRRGETRWLRESAIPCRHDDGGWSWDGAWLDVTPQRRAEQRFQTVMDHAKDAILTLDLNTGIDWANATTERLFGWPMAELIGLPLSQLLADSDRSWTAQTDDGLALFAQNFPRGSQEILAMRRDGTTFPFEMTVSEVRYDGRLSLIVIGRDITRRKNAELMLEETEVRLRTIASNLPGVVFQRRLEADGNFAYSYMSEGIVEIVGHEAAEIVENANLLFNAMIDADRERLLRGLARSAQNLDPVDEAVRVIGPDGHVRWLSGQARPRLREDTIVWDGLILDVTEQKRSAEERRQLELALTEGQKLEALGRLAGGVAHELNNMLGPILMGAEMMTRTAALDAKNQERVTRIIDAARHGRDIVRNVLAYCRKEQKTLAPIDIAAAFRQFADLAASVLPPTITVETHVAVEGAMIMGDSAQITQILLNLANNARDAMDGQGTLTLSLEPIAGAALGAQPPLPPATGRASLLPQPFAKLDHTLDYVEIRVTDTGCGISADTAAKIFDPFFTTKPVDQGTGLGLSVVQGIIKVMGGAIALESAPGRGASFRLVLPRLVQAPNGTSLAPKEE